MPDRTPATTAVPVEVWRDDLYQSRDGRKARFHRNFAATVGEGSYGSFEFRGDGPTATAARADLGAKLADFLGGYRRPVVIRYRGNMIVLSADFGYDGPVIESAQYGPEGERSCTTTTDWDWPSAIKRARGHLAQIGVADWTDDAELLAALAWLDDSDLGAELLAYARFQRAYAYAVGIGEADPHRWCWDRDTTSFTPDLPTRPKEVTNA